MTRDVPDFAAARDHVIQQVVAFARRLQDDGVAVPADAALAAVRALGEVGLDDRGRVRAATHATLVSDAADREVFAEQFPGFWYRLRSGLEATATRDDVGDRADDSTLTDHPTETAVEGVLDGGGHEAVLEGTGDLAADEGEVQSRRVAETAASPTDRVADDQRPRTYSPAGARTDVTDADAGTTVDRAAVRRLERALQTLPGRRWIRTGVGDVIDARRALRESLDTGGVAISLPEREREQAAFRLCLLVDVSRSVLDSVDRGFLLSFVDALVTDSRDVRVFFFDTAVREVTEVFASGRGDPATALERAELAWGGGTRIGASLRTLREQWPHAVGRRTITLVVSDGLEVGAVPDLDAEVAWLASRARVLIWLNPLATSTAYEPTCQGMSAALPYVDGLFAFGGNADIAEVARQLERFGASGPIGYEHDSRDRGGVSTG